MTTTTARRIAGPRLLTGVQVILVLTALIWGIAAPVAWAMSWSRAGEPIEVYVIAGRAAPELTAPMSPGQASPLTQTLPITTTNDLISGDVAGFPLTLGADNHDLVLTVAGSTLPEQLLTYGDALLVGLSVAAAALLLRKVVSSIASGQPFTQRNARRLLGVAGAAAVAGFIAPLLPWAGAALVLHRVHASGAVASVAPSDVPDLSTLLLIGLLLAVAEGFRQAEALHRDTTGLV